MEDELFAPQHTVKQEDLRSESQILAESLVAEQKVQRHDAQRPDIDHLTDAVTYLDDGTAVFVPEVGERIVIERYASILTTKPWLDTKVYRVEEIDHDTGKLRLWDEEAINLAGSNFIEGPRCGYKFKMVPKGDNPLKAAEKRLEVTEEAPKPISALGALKKKRGRPKGSKNKKK